MNLRTKTKILVIAITLATTSQIASSATEIALKNFAQIYQGLVISFGFETVPVELKETFVLLKSRLPQSGRIEDMNSAVPAAHLTLTHKACQFFVREESAKPAAKRLAFGPVDFSIPVSDVKPALLLTASANVGKLLLTEPLTASQQSIVVEHMQKLIPILKDSPNATVLLMTEVCAAVGSSLGALVI